MRIVSISGTNGCGKTTTIKKLTAIIAASGKRSGIIVNDYGKETYEDDFIQSHKISIEYLRGG